MNFKTLRNIISAMLLFLSVPQIFAQVPTYITAGGTANNVFPFASATNKVQWVYTPTEFVPTIPGGLITHVFFRSNNAGGSTVTFNDLRISIGHVTFSTFTSSTFETGLTECYLQTSTTISVPSNGWFGVQLSTPFVYNGTSNLVVEATITNTTSVQLAQDGTNGNKRIWGTRTATTGTGFGAGQAPCGLEIVTCSTAITKHPVPNVTVCEGQQTGFKSGAIDVTSYQWQVNEGSGYVNIANGVNYSGATTDTLTVKAIPASFDGYRYRCLALKSSCVDSSNPALLRVNALVSLGALPGNDTTCIGSIKDFRIKGTGAITSYKWQIFNQTHGFIDVPNSPPYIFMNDTLRINGVPDTLNGSIFRCVVNGICNSATTTSTNLQVNTVPSVAVHPVDVLSESGVSVHFQVQATGKGATYQWQVATNTNPAFVNINEGGIYEGVKTNRLTVKGVTRVQDGFKFRCVIGTSSGCITPGDPSNFALLNVKPLVSVASINSDDLMLLYPNPTGNSDLYIKLGNGLAGNEMKYKVVDKTGRTIMVGNMNGNDMTRVDVSRLSADVYLVQILDAGNQIVAQSRFTRL